MKRYISIILVLLLWALMLPGCKASTPSTPGTTPQADVPVTTTAPADTPDPNPLVTVYLLTGCTNGDTNTTFVYNAAGKLLEVSADGEIVVAYTYDEQGNCLSYKNTFQGIDQTYDAQGNTLTDKTENGLITNTYDEQGNLLSETLEQDGSICYEILHTYDEAGRHLTQTYYRDGEISDEAPSYVWEYDPLTGKLLSECVYHGRMLMQRAKYNYGKNGLLEYSNRDLRDGDHLWHYYTYDKAGRVTSITEKIYEEGRHIDNFTSYQYNSHGHLIKVKYDYDSGLDRTVCWIYDDSGYILMGCSVVSTDTNYAYLFTYDANQRKTAEVRTGDDPHEIAWEYDAQGRVISMVRTGTGAYRETYVYDAFGNLIQCNHTADSVTTVTSYTYTAITVTEDLAAQIRYQQAALLQGLNEDRE